MSVLKSDLLVISRSGSVHEYHCLSLTDEGDCDCRKQWRRPRWKPKVIPKSELRLLS